ncbi:uncharacterized protein LOC127251147 isoform X2 [Andrographis paniculata]|uniref:uncharacterized protein LOC127251147 isoform X2 n=1 Tax=Andrographis paniculata TaxID=175694 RepID=UPI0021E994DF|nr:uncharacterized protein LOC127251147 isoform X2 [Andrographis paniculata]
MRLGFCWNRLAAPRFFELSGVGKTTIRGMQSKSDGNSTDRRDTSSGKEQGQPQQWHTPQSYEDHFPSLSASVGFKTKGRRRTRVDLGNSSEQKSKEIKNNAALKHETLTSIIHQRDTGLKEKGHLSCNESKTTRAHDGHGELKKSPMSSTQAFRRVGELKKSPTSLMQAVKDEPFDICLPKGKSSVMEVNGQRWVRKVKVDVESAEEDYESNDNWQRDDAVGESGQVLRPGMVLFKNYLSLHEQVNIVKKCRELGCCPGGFYRPGYNDGAKLRLYMMCLGLDWDPQTRSYGEICCRDNVKPPAIPSEFASIVSRALDDSHALIRRDNETIDAKEVLPKISPDVCIVNFYATTGRLGLHQDRDESAASLDKGLPVVSISIGDSAEFLYGDNRDVDRATCEKLESGDVLIFGGESRHIFHGVRAILPDTAPPPLLEITNLRSGRLNLTFRKY